MEYKIPKTKQPLPTRGVQSSTNIWLQQMAQADTKIWGMQQKPLWVIDNKIYDLTQFINKHPGGSSWITMTKGQDITTLFVTHHLEQHKTRQILARYYISQAKIKNQPRFDFTQHYNQIRKRILSKFKIQELNDTSSTSFVSYTLLIGWFLLVGICSNIQSYILAMLCGFLMMAFYGIGHLFIHRKTPNILSHVYLLIGFSAQEQQIMHAISHHPYANTMLDYQFAGVQPIMNFARCLPCGKWYSFIALQILFILIGPINVITKVVIVPILTKGKQKISWQHLIFPLQIIYMYLFTNDIRIALKLWAVMILVYGFTFGKMVTCPHRQIQLWSENSSQIKDYVLHMIATTTDTNHSPMSAFQSLIFYSGFNIHALHHLFPTIDHSKISVCNEIFMKYCKQKGLKVTVSKSMLECNKNMWNLQLGRKQFQLKIFANK